MRMTYQTDVVVVGAGSVGCAIARELSKYKIDVMLIDKKEDICGDASKSNNGTAISGYDSPPGSLHAKLILGTNAMLDTIARELDVKFIRKGCMVLGFTEEDEVEIKKIYRNSVDVGLYDTMFLTGEKCLEMEPHINPQTRCGFVAPSETPIDVMELMIAQAENAVENGVRILLSAKVTGVKTEKFAIHTVQTTKGEIRTKFLINAAGVYADEIAKYVGVCDYRNYPRRGEVLVLDKNLPYCPTRVIAPTPTPISRGKIISPSLHGNMLIGPSAHNAEDRDDKATHKEVLDDIIRATQKLIPEINRKDIIRQYVGIRPTKAPSGWKIEASGAIKGYIEAVGITAGVSAGAAIGVYIANMLDDEGLKMERKPDFNPYRMSIRRFYEMSLKEQDEYIKKDPRYGNVICRCESVTEAEIVQAIHRTPGARSVDGIKRRLRCGMGRCQGGFCTPRIVEILARELQVEPETITKNEPGSEILTGKNR